ncbi:MAG: hypothetical protein E2P04_06230 [Acidobacteria bacterium]|nr:MAG: hypothetical protein E2P04_06230 [Acidobacteriota bacterium]
MSLRAAGSAAALFLVLLLPPVSHGRQPVAELPPFQTADEMRRQGHLGRAEALYRRDLKAHPGHPQGLFGLGQLLLAEHRYREAENVFRNLGNLVTTPEKRAAALVGQGRALAGRGEHGMAAQRFEQAHHQSDAQGEALARLGLARQAQGDLARAGRIWEEYLQLRPGMPLAVQHLQRARHLQREIRRLRAQLDSNAGNPGIAARYAQILEQAGNPAGAAAVLGKQDVVGWPLGGDPRYRQAILALRAGSAEEAGRLLRGHLRDFHHHLAGFYTLAATEAATGNRQAEALAWMGALTLRPGDRFAARSRFRALAMAQALEPEIERLQGLLAHSVTSERARIQLALALQVAGRADEAVPRLLRALELEPNDNGILEPLRDLLEGRPQRLIRAVAELTRRAERRPAALRARAALRTLLGDAEGGAEDLGLLQERFPDDVRTQVALAYARRELGDLASARALLESATRQSPDYPFARLDLAALALSQGEPDVALLHARRALHLLPLESLGHTLAGAALIELNQVPEALTELGRALALAPADPSGHILPLAMRAFLLAGDPESVRLFLVGGVALEPEQLYLLAWRYLRDTYVGDGMDRKDWLEWKHRFHGQLHDMVDAHAAIGRLAASLDDPHTKLLDQADGLARLLAAGEVLASDPDTGDGSRSLYWKLREEGGLYLRLTSLRDPAAARAVEQVLDSLPEVVEVVLDLRGNPGGYEDQARRIAELLLPEGRTAPGWRTRTGETLGAGRRGTAGALSVQILVDGKTGSAAEHLAEDLLQGGAASLVGGPTVGKRDAQIPFILPDGWTLLVTAARRDLAPAVDSP